MKTEDHTHALRHPCEYVVEFGVMEAAKQEDRSPSNVYDAPAFML
jgi:hypothetical protein